MLAPQSIDPSDAIMVFDGMDIITERGKDTGVDSDYQKTLAELGYTTIQVDVSLIDMTDNTEHVKSNITMTYKSAAMFWSILIADLITDDGGSPLLLNGHKFIGSIKMSGAETDASKDMRTFQVLEFVVDDRGLEKTLMTQGYELDFTVSPPKFIWRDSQGTITYEALAYTGGTGTTGATSPADVTHRGPVVKV